jgi:hypothetical protein
MSPRLHGPDLITVYQAPGPDLSAYSLSGTPLSVFETAGWSPVPRIGTSRVVTRRMEDPGRSGPAVGRPARRIDLVLGADPLAAAQAILALNIVGGLAAQEVGRRLDAAADLRSRTRLMVLDAVVGRGLPGVLMKVLAIAAEHDDPEHRDAASRASRLVFGDLAHHLAAAPR